MKFPQSMLQSASVERGVISVDDNDTNKALHWLAAGIQQKLTQTICQKHVVGGLAMPMYIEYTELQIILP